MDSDKPDLVIIYGPEMRPDYEEMVRIKNECVANGQTVHLIPPADESGTKPRYDIEKQSLGDIGNSLAEIYPSGSKQAYTLYIATHGSTNGGKHEIYIGDNVSVQDILSTSLKHGECKGFYNGSCSSGGSLIETFDAIAEHRKSNNSEKDDFQFVSDAPLNQTAGMQDSVDFLRKLPEYSSQGTAFTAINLQNKYMLTLGDSTSKYSNNLYRKNFSDEELRSGNVEVGFSDLGTKLERLIEESNKPNFSLTIPASAQEIMGAEATKQLQEILSQENTRVYNFQSEDLWGEALILAQEISPAENEKYTQEYITLLTSSGWSLANKFSQASEATKIRFTKDNPQSLLNVGEYLSEYPAQTAEHVKNAAKSLSEMDDGSLISPFDIYSRHPSSREWGWAFEDQNELIDVLANAKDNQDDRTRQNIFIDELVTHLQDGKHVEALLEKASSTSELLRDPKGLIRNIQKLPNTDIEQIVNSTIDRMISESPYIAVTSEYGIEEMFVESGKDRNDARELSNNAKTQAAENLLEAIQDTSDAGRANVRQLAPHARAYYIMMQGGWIEYLPPEKQEAAKEAIETFNSAPKQASTELGYEEAVQNLVSNNIRLPNDQLSLDDVDQSQVYSGLPDQGTRDLS